VNDREMLELAAKAAGLDYWIVRFAPRSKPIEKIHTQVNGETVEWNPLTDDGDALRLAVKTGVNILPPDGDDCGTAATHRCLPVFYSEKAETGDDAYAATRRAIVRAAAAIGEAMP